MRHYGSDEDAPELESLLARTLAIVDGSDEGALEELCRQHPAHAAQLRERFAQLRRADSVDPGAEPSAASSPGRLERIGPYHILGLLGQGGMGTVYLAEQQEPVQRRVAVKVVRLGMNSTEIIARFEAERQALALMSHPNIASVFDAGTAADGRPFFVMEHVPGVPLADYCDRQRLNLEQRIRLVVQVCQGIQHAHQKGIIHRDIKPSNVLVQMQEGRPIPKIIDFGVAKALDQRLTERTLYTEEGRILGTPEDMSPEQAEMSGLGIDARSDVYSLGVMLYELLVGALPFDARELRQAGFREIQRRIREVEPPRPGTRISTLGEKSSDAAQRRRTDRSALARRLRGELDWIAMKALEKDPTRRYQSASELGADLDRYLNDEPVLAGPPTARYRFRKLVHKHRGKVAATAAVFLATAAGCIISFLLYLDADRARQVAADARAAADVARETERAARARAEEALARVESSDYRNTIALADRYWLDDNVARMREMLDQCPERLRGWEWHYMQRRCHGESNAVECEPGYQVAFGPNGRILAVCGAGGSVRLLRTDDWQEERSLRGHRGPVRCLSFSGDGRRLVTSGMHDGMVRVYDVASGQAVLATTESRGVVVDVAIDRTGSRIAWATTRTRERDGVRFELHRPLRVKVWDVERNQEIAELQNSGMDVALSPDGKFVATVTFNMLGTSCDLCLWDVASERIRTRLRSLPYPSGAVSYSPSNDWLLVASGTEAALWDLHSHQQLRALDGHTKRVYLAAANGDGTLLATADHGGVVRVWDAKSGDEKRVLRVGDGIASMSLSPDGARLATAAGDGGVRIWDVTQPQGALKFDVPAQRIAFVPGERRLAVVTDSADDPVVAVWELPSGELRQRLGAAKRKLGVRADPVVATSPDGLWVAAGTSDGRIRLWDVRSGEAGAVISGHAGPIVSLAFDASSSRLAAADEGERREDSRGGMTFTTAVQPGRVRIWGIPSGREQLVLDHTAPVDDVAFSPDGLHLALATASREKGDQASRPVGVIQIHDATSGRLLQTLRGHQSRVTAVAFDPGGQTLASASWDKSVRLWQTETWTPSHVLRGHQSYVRALAFTADGRRLASASQTVKIWDPASGREVLTLSSTRDSVVSSLVFSRDGWLASVLDYRVMVWDGRPSL